MGTNEAVSPDQLTSSNRDPTLAVTSSIPEPCAAVSFPAMALLRRWVWDSHGGLQRWEKVGGSTNTGRRVCLKTAYKAGNLSEEPELKPLGWSIFFLQQWPCIYPGVAARSELSRRRFAAAAGGGGRPTFSSSQPSPKKFPACNRRRVAEDSRSFQRSGLPPKRLCSVEESLRKQDAVPGASASPSAEDRLGAPPRLRHCANGNTRHS